MLKVAIVGCGKIADSHLAQIQRLPNCQVVAACDREELMAGQLCERFGVPNAFKDLGEMLRATRPDVVHITTPPQGHLPLAKQCLQSGSNVYVEKPFTLDTAEAEELIAEAERVGLRITVGHDDQFSHVARRLRAAIASGALGGKPVHMESHYCYELSGTYAKALLGDRNHWVRRLPGGLLQNIISHGVARIAEHLTGDNLKVIAHGFASPFLRQLGDAEIVDELRVIINDDNRTTAYFTFSSQMRPALHHFAVYGPKHGLLLDEDQQTLIKVSGDRLKSYAERFIPPLKLARQHASNVLHNFGIFLRRDFHFKSGMKFLIENFYASIREGKPLPIPYQEIILTSRLMDAIFDQLREQQAAQSHEVMPLTMGSAPLETAST